MDSLKNSRVLTVGSRSHPGATSLNSPSRRAFSIVEVLVVMGVVAMLIGLALPPLGRVREASLTLKSESNLKQIGFVMASYQQAHEDIFPFGEEGQLYPSRIDPSAMRESFEHFEFDRAWPVVVRSVASWNDFAGTMVSPGWRKKSVLPCDYIYSHAFLARPALWSGMATIEDVSFLRPVSAADAAFPADKVIVWDGAAKFLLQPRLLPSGMLANPLPMLFVDSHVAQHRFQDAADPVTNPLNPNPATRGIPIHNTPWGARGRDY